MMVTNPHLAFFIVAHFHNREKSGLCVNLSGLNNLFIATWTDLTSCAGEEQLLQHHTPTDYLRSYQREGQVVASMQYALPLS